MSNEIEYIEPTQEHVGQMVEVRDGEDQGWRNGKLIAIIDHEYGFIAQYPEYTWGACCKFARIPRPLTYAERQARCGLKVGDRVKFVRMWEQGSCDLTPFESISKWVGSCGAITDITDDGIGVQFNGMSWGLPYFVLEKVEDRAATRRDIDATVYVDGNPQDVFTLEHWYSCDDQPYRAVVRSGDKRFVYELSNLRVKE